MRAVGACGMRDGLGAAGGARQQASATRAGKAQAASDRDSDCWRAISGVATLAMAAPPMMAVE